MSSHSTEHRSFTSVLIANRRKAQRDTERDKDEDSDADIVEAVYQTGPGQRATAG